MLEQILSLMGKKRFYEGYASVASGSYADANIDPPSGRVYVVVSIDVSMEKSGYVALYKGDRRDAWLTAQKIITRYSDDVVISMDRLFLILTDADRAKIRVSNGSATATSTVYVNYEYFDLSETEFEKLKDVLKDQYKVI